MPKRKRNLKCPNKFFPDYKIAGCPDVGCTNCFKTMAIHRFSKLSSIKDISNAMLASLFAMNHAKQYCPTDDECIIVDGVKDCKSCWKNFIVKKMEENFK